jgi:hypothetical protein
MLVLCFIDGKIYKVDRKCPYEGEIFSLHLDLG